MDTFYRYTKNKQGQSVKVKMTPSQIKAEIMKINNWTPEQYKKNYDIFKNKLRSFEAFERAKGVDVETQSARDLLYKEAKAKKRFGNLYQPSIKMQRIREFTSISSGKALEKALQSKKYTTAREMTYSEKSYKQFEGLIAGKNKNPIAEKIWYTIKDPVKREQALIDLANKINAKIDEQTKAMKESGEAIPSGEVFGSSDVIEFDIGAYM